MRMSWFATVVMMLCFLGAIGCGEKKATEKPADKAAKEKKAAKESPKAKEAPPAEAAPAAAPEAEEAAPAEEVEAEEAAPAEEAKAEEAAPAEEAKAEGNLVGDELGARPQAAQEAVFVVARPASEQDSIDRDAREREHPQHPRQRTTLSWNAPSGVASPARMPSRASSSRSKTGPPCR